MFPYVNDPKSSIIADGVPRSGVVKVGEVDSTTPPLPVELAVTPVPPRATDKVPVVPAIIGKPVILVAVPDAGVPSAGVVKVGEVRVLLVRV
jgi:hypothetical protein